MPAGVLELEELDVCPLDVGQAAGAQLGVQGLVGAARQPLGLDPGLDAADLTDRVLVEAGASGQRTGSITSRNPAAQGFRVAGDRFGPQQRLGLPERGPAAVVLGVGSEGADQRPLAALGAQIGVDRRAPVRPGWPA